MEEEANRIVSPPTEVVQAEERMLGADLVREITARRERGEGAKRIARELGVDRKTVKRWLRLGSWQPRRGRTRPKLIDEFAGFITQRGPEVGWNGVVLLRELRGLGFSGSYQQVQRFLQPHRARRKWSELATVRFETEPGEQAQVDYGQLRVWIGEHPETVHLFVFTLGYSRRLYTRGYRNERLATLLDGHERALRHFGGVTLTCLYDNDWLERWSGEVADLRVHGTTHERPIDRFTREHLTPLGNRPAYRYERVRLRRVASDALVAVEATRYSVPVEYVGLTVSVQESAEHYEFFHQERLIARHLKSARHSVVMDPTHYAGLLRVGRQAAMPVPPRFDPGFARLGDVMVRELAQYEAISQSQGGAPR